MQLICEPATAAPHGAAVFTFPFCVAKRLALLLLLVSMTFGAWAQKPRAFVPPGPDTIIEVLPRGYAAIMPKASKSPTTIGEIQRLLNVAALTGDSRLAARAERQLGRLPKSDTRPETLRARAFSAQHRHDFAAAAVHLDQLIAREPRDGDARLARAQIRMVQGDLRSARSECAALALTIDSSRGLVCLTALALRNGELRSAAESGDRWLARAIADDPLRNHVLTMRGETASRQRSAGADAWFRRALQSAPGDVRVLAAYSRHLRRSGRAGEVLSLLPPSTASDGLQLERALAAKAAGAPGWEQLALSQGRRYRLTRSLGSTPELRDEAEYYLGLANDPAAALRLSLENFRTQRDYEDVDLLQRAAAAAGRPGALSGLQAWALAQKLALARPGAERR